VNGERCQSGRYQCFGGLVKTYRPVSADFAPTRRLADNEPPPQAVEL